MGGEEETDVSAQEERVSLLSSLLLLFCLGLSRVEDATHASEGELCFDHWIKCSISSRNAHSQPQASWHSSDGFSSPDIQADAALPGQ